MRDYTILIIEDDEVAMEIMQQFVQHHYPSAKLEWCWNGFEALVRVEETNPDLIFLDYMMPKIDGMEFIKALKSVGTTKGMNIVVISAYVNDEKTQQFLDLGADEVLPKPINIEQIERILKKFDPAK